jgi:hypothetical protein
MDHAYPWFEESVIQGATSTVAAIAVVAARQIEVKSATSERSTRCDAAG